MAISRSENMSRIRSADTNCERLLRRELTSMGFKFKLNDKAVFGKPDIVFSKRKVAVFCDSEFWHGKKLRQGEVPKTNRAFWIEKLSSNVKRDRLVTRTLRKDGWIVIRLWEADIKKNPASCALKIVKHLRLNSEKNNLI